MLVNHLVLMDFELISRFVTCLVKFYHQATRSALKSEVIGINNKKDEAKKMK